MDKKPCIIEHGTKIPVPGKGIVTTTAHLDGVAQILSTNEFNLKSYELQIVNPSNDGRVLKSSNFQGDPTDDHFKYELIKLADTFLSDQERYHDDPKRSETNADIIRDVDSRARASVLEIVALTREQLEKMSKVKCFAIPIVTTLDYGDGTFIECPNTSPEFSEEAANEGETSCKLTREYGPFTLPDGRTFYFVKNFPFLVEEVGEYTNVRSATIQGSKISARTTDTTQAVFAFFDQLASQCGQILCATHETIGAVVNHVPWLRKFCDDARDSHTASVVPSQVIQNRIIRLEEARR